jgi:hypothetical protein
MPSTNSSKRTEMITSTELLEFLYKAQQVSGVGATFRQVDGGYAITMRNDWYDDGRWSTQGVFITNEGESTWDNVIKINGVQCFDFYTMDNILDEMLVEQKQKEIKEQKRQELIARLTDEEKELLGVK